MKIKITLFSLMGIIALASVFTFASAAVDLEVPPAATSEVEGSNDAPPAATSEVEGGNDVPPGAASEVEGEVGPVAEQETTNNRSSRSGGSKKVPTGNLSSGEVLGASTDDGSCKVLTTFMKVGEVNNVEEVKMLQTFLNTQMSVNLPITGFFGPMTFQAVKDFQEKYKIEILKPWADLGLMDSQEIGTGYVYQTTQYKINTMLCPDAEIAKPVLN